MSCLRKGENSAWVYLIDTVKKQYGLKVQIHKPDEPEKCEAHNYELNGKPGSFKIGKEITQKQELNLETSMNTCPVYRISNLLTSDNIYGHDDYEPIDSIVAEIMSVRTGGKATLSQYTAIQRLDDMSAADTDAELAMIRSDDIDSSVGLEETALEPIEGI